MSSINYKSEFEKYYDLDSTKNPPVTFDSISQSSRIIFPPNDDPGLTISERIDTLSPVGKVLALNPFSVLPYLVYAGTRSSLYDDSTEIVGNLGEPYWVEWAIQHGDVKISTEDELKELFFVFSQKTKFKDKTISIKDSTNQILIPSGKIWQNFDQDNVFGRLVKPLLINYFADFMASTTVDLITKNMVKEWWDSTSDAELILKMNEISTATRDKFTFGNLSSWASAANTATIIQPSVPVIDNNYVFVGNFQNLIKNSYDLSDKIFEIFGFSAFLKKKGETFGFSGNTVASLEDARNRRLAWYAEAAAKVLDVAEVSAEEEMNLKQCALISALTVGGGSGYDLQNDYLKYAKTGSPLSPGSGSSAAHNRIFPVWPDKSLDPNLFLNYCTIDFNMKPVFESGNALDPDSINKNLFWVYEASSSYDPTTQTRTGGGLREIEIPISSVSADQNRRRQVRKLRQVIVAYANFQGDTNLSNEISKIYGSSISLDAARQQFEALNQEITREMFQATSQDGYFFLKNTNIKYEGTNPSTARNDVQVTLTFELSSIAVLTQQLVELNGANDGLGASDKLQFRIMDLITISTTNNVSSELSNSFVASGYRPKQSRLRLKVWANSQNTKDLSAMVLDLASIDHSITRDGETGVTTLVINYRGFFESMMSLPFNDAIASENSITSRWERQQKALDVLMQNGCNPATIREAMRIDQQILQRETRGASFKTLLEKLNDRKLIHSYTLDTTAYLGAKIGRALDGRKNCISQINYKQTITFKEVQTLDGELKDQKDKDAKDIKTSDQIIKDKSLTTLGGKFFFLGDLIWVAADCLFKPDSFDHREWVKDLNLRFIISSIMIPDPNGVNTNLQATKIINPAVIPIDLSFFVQWFNSVVVNKNMSYYPIGVFLRDLLERLVNNILYETCFAVLLPDEQPPQLRTGYFSKDDITQFAKRNDGWWDFKKPFQNAVSNNFLFPRELVSSNPTPSSTISSSKVESLNYCVIYQQFPTMIRQAKAKSAKTLKDDASTISIYYGLKNIPNNFITNVSFSKTNSPGLREARFFNNSYGNLSLLSNVYDLSFSFVNKKANTFFFPGNIINFYLLDWGDNWDATERPWDVTATKSMGHSDPHVNGTIANITGMGGYFVILSVEYDLKETPAEFEIKINTKFIGSDGNKTPASANQNGRIEDTKACIDAYEVLADRANELYEAGDESFAQGIVTTPSTTTPIAAQVPQVTNFGTNQNNPTEIGDYFSAMNLDIQKNIPTNAQWKRTFSGTKDKFLGITIEDLNKVALKSSNSSPLTVNDGKFWYQINFTKDNTTNKIISIDSVEVYF